MNQPPFKRADRVFGIYLGSFLLIWTVYVLLIYRHVQSLAADSFGYAAASIGVRLIVWVLPVFLILRFVDRANPLRALGLVEHRQRGVLVGIGLSAVLFAASAIRFGWPHDVGHNLTWNSVLGTSLAIGLIEEIPFRGFILQKLWTRTNFWLANGLTSLLFVALHLPGWFMLQLFALRTAAYVLVLSFVWGMMFRYSRSLWSCIISHSSNDFISFVLFHGL